MDVLGRIVDLVRSRLADHRLTMSRFVQDISAAWDEISLVEGIDYNVAIVERYVDRILADVRAFVSDVVNDVLTAVRAAAATALQPLLDRPEVKPYWDLATKVFHYDPLRGVEVQAPTVEILADFLHLAGRDAVLAQMQERGTLQQTADWLDTQFARFGRILADTSRASPTPGTRSARRTSSTCRRGCPSWWTAPSPWCATSRHSSPRSWSPSSGSSRTPSSAGSASTPTSCRGFRLLTVILGRNPFTGAAVDRTAENLIGGFIALLPNGEATYQQLAQSGVIARHRGPHRVGDEPARHLLGADHGDVHGRLGTPSASRTSSPRSPAFERVLRMFGEPLGRIVDFVIVVVQAVIELILAADGFPSDLLGHIIDQRLAGHHRHHERPGRVPPAPIDALKQPALQLLRPHRSPTC